MCWCCGQVCQRDLAGTAPVGRDQRAILERRTPATGAVLELHPQRAVVESLNGSGAGGPEVRLVVDPVEKGAEDVGLNREDLEEQPERVVLPPIECRHGSPLSHAILPSRLKPVRTGHFGQGVAITRSAPWLSCSLLPLPVM